MYYAINDERFAVWRLSSPQICRRKRAFIDLTPWSALNLDVGQRHSSRRTPRASAPGTRHNLRVLHEQQFDES